ncbi:hypothetical protein TNIN_320901, partial [Trichonephila inaurata madagascariensis]
MAALSEWSWSQTHDHLFFIPFSGFCEKIQKIIFRGTQEGVENRTFSKCSMPSKDTSDHP